MRRPLRRRKLDFEPISTDDYLAELKDLKADRKALHDRYRQSRAYELSEALTKIENALRALYGRLFDRARMMSVHQIALTTERQIEAERITRDRFNQCAERVGWGVRLEPCGGPIEGGSLKRALADMQKPRPSLNSAAASGLLACSNFFG
jgi:hypothetical protein